MDQQELLRAAMLRFGMSRDQFAHRLEASRRTLDKWLLPVDSNDFREMPGVARKFVEDLFNKYRLRFDISPMGIYIESMISSNENTMGYKSVVAALDWVFVVLPVPPGNELIVWRIAAWALSEQGDVVGLVSVRGGGQGDEVMGKTCRLVAPPPLRGIYKHISELDQDEKTALLSGKPIKIES